MLFLFIRHPSALIPYFPGIYRAQFASKVSPRLVVAV
jgi:hypothetical protein